MPSFAFSVMLKPANKADTTILAALHQANFKRGWSEAEFLSFFEKEGVVAYLAMDETVAVGFVFCWVVAGECELLCVAVNEPSRGEGIAKQLCELAIQSAQTQGAAVMHLEVAVSNKAAQALYQKLGFEVMHRRKGYYRHPDGTREDALTMRAKL